MPFELPARGPLTIHYPRTTHVRFGESPQFDLRTIRVLSIRDLVREPLTPEEFLRRPSEVVFCWRQVRFPSLSQFGRLLKPQANLDDGEIARNASNKAPFSIWSFRKVSNFAKCFRVGWYSCRNYIKKISTLITHLWLKVYETIEMLLCSFQHNTTLLRS